MTLISALLSVLAVLVAVPPALAQDLHNDMVDIAYAEPIDPAHRPIYERLKARKVLEEFQEFLAPLKLPSKLLVKTEGCKGAVNSWYSNGAITLCYEYIDYIRKLAPQGPVPEGMSAGSAVLGPFVDVLLHETAHAVFHLLEVPVLGREEDAADQVAAFLLLQFGKDVARRTLTGVAYMYGLEKTNGTPTDNDFADVHGTPAQRFYNNLCIAYGGDPNTFNDFVQKKLLPRGRALGCQQEYQKLAFAFQKLILPYIDVQLMKKVQARDWLKPGDGR